MAVTVELVFFIDALLWLNTEQSPVCPIRPAHCRSYCEGVPARPARRAAAARPSLHRSRFAAAGVMSLLVEWRFITTGCANGDAGSPKWKGRVDLRLSGLRHDFAVPG